MHCDCNFQSPDRLTKVFFPSSVSTYNRPPVLSSTVTVTAGVLRRKPEARCHGCTGFPASYHKWNNVQCRPFLPCGNGPFEHNQRQLLKAILRQRRPTRYPGCRAYLASINITPRSWPMTAQFLCIRRVWGAMWRMGRSGKTTAGTWKAFDLFVLLLYFQESSHGKGLPSGDVANPSPSSGSFSVPSM